MKVLKVIGFWLASYTWGIIMTLIGTVVSLALLVTGHKPKTFGYAVYFEVGEGWGGVELGPFFLCSKGCGLHTKQHEFGHGIQNIILGPLFPFLVAMPSALRYHIRNGKNADSRIFLLTGILGTALVVMALATVIPAIVFTITWPLIIMALFLAYDLSLFFWQLGEIKAYVKAGNEDEDYDAAWFEGQASAIGLKLYQKDTQPEQE